MSILQRRRSAVVYIAGLISGLALAALLGLRPGEESAVAQTQDDSNLAASVAELRQSVQNLRERVDDYKERIVALEELTEGVITGDVVVGEANTLDGIDSTEFQKKLTAGDGIVIEDDEIKIDFAELNTRYLSVEGGSIKRLTVEEDLTVEGKTRLGNFIGRPAGPQRGTGIFNGESGRVEFYDGKAWRGL